MPVGRMSRLHGLKGFEVKVEKFNPFRNDIISVDGLWGTDKRLLSPMVSGMDRVEKAKAEHIYEYVRSGGRRFPALPRCRRVFKKWFNSHAACWNPTTGFVLGGMAGGPSLFVPILRCGMSVGWHLEERTWSEIRLLVRWFGSRTWRQRLEWNNCHYA